MGSLHTVTTMNTNEKQEITVDLTVGDHVILYESTDIGDGARGYTGSVLFEGTVEQYVPDTGLMRFTNASEDIGRRQFFEYLSQSVGVTVLEG